MNNNKKNKRNMPMTMTWILVANDSEARLLESSGAKETIRLIKKYAHPKGRMKDGEINADAPGRSFDSVGGQRHSMGHEVSPHRREEEIFAKELMDHLEQGFSQGRFSLLALIAPPHLLGTLREILPKALKKAVISETPKDYPSWISDKDLIQKLESETS
jgi:protein required for attachment to host cells